MIKSVGAAHVLVGHSERRVVFGQSDEDFNKNLLKILDTVSYCVQRQPVPCVLVRNDQGLGFRV